MWGTEVPQWDQVPTGRWSLGNEVLQNSDEAFLVNECLNVDVLEEIFLVKRQKYHHKNQGQLKAG